MKLEYKILWLDDNIDTFIDDEHIQDIEQYISDQGFEATINTQSNQREFFSNLDDTYDLILTDYHMDGLNGDQVVEKIRKDESIFTEILFYTAKADLKDTQKLDRISFLETTTSHQEEVVEKIKELIALTIKKFQDIVVMRGMIMHETSDLDSEKIKILKQYIDSKSVSEIQGLKDDVLEKIQRFLDEKCNTYLDYKDRDDALKKIIKDNVLFSSSRKIEALSWILKKLGLDDFSEEYQNEIISPRNQFAHAKLIEEDGRKYFKKTDGDIEFDDAYCQNLRKNILKHKGNLKKLQEKVNE